MNAHVSSSGRHMPATSPFDVLAEELGAVAGRIEREAALRIDAALADVRRVDAERELRLVQLERRVDDVLARVKDGEPGKSVSIDDVRPLVADVVREAVAAIPPPKDGAPGRDIDPAVINRMVQDAVSAAVAAIPKPSDGKDADPILIRQLVDEAIVSLPSAPAGKDADPVIIKQMVDAAVAGAMAAVPAPANGKDADPAVIAEMVKAAVTALPPAPAGRDADPEDIRQMVAEAITALPPAKDGAPGRDGKDGAPGKLPLIKEWEDRVFYEGEVAVFDGRSYQAICDTGRQPPHEDWRCIAERGADGASGKDGVNGTNGADGRSFRVRGTWLEIITDYRALDVVALNGASFIAKRDEPGPCPGEGWQMIAAQGKRGQPGQKGDRGERGEPGMPVVAAEIGPDGILKLTNGDGSQVDCDLYPLLSKLAR